MFVSRTIYGQSLISIGLYSLRVRLLIIISNWKVVHSRHRPIKRKSENNYIFISFNARFAWNLCNIICNHLFTFHETRKEKLSQRDTSRFKITRLSNLPSGSSVDKSLRDFRISSTKLSDLKSSEYFASSIIDRSHYKREHQELLHSRNIEIFGNVRPKVPLPIPERPVLPKIKIKEHGWGNSSGLKVCTRNMAEHSCGETYSSKSPWLCRYVLFPSQHVHTRMRTFQPEAPTLQMKSTRE